MIDKIDILHKSHCCYFACHTGKETAGLLCVVTYHHEIVVELGEYCFDTFTEPPVCPHWRTPVLLIQPIWDFKSNIGYLKEILLHLGTKIALVRKHHAVVIFPAYILADFFGKPRRQLTPGIELPAAYKVWQIVLALMVQTMEKEIFTVESKSLCCYAESYDLEVRELWDNPTSGHISEFIHTISGEILADTENSDEICYEVAHKQNNSSW